MPFFPLWQCCHTGSEFSSVYIIMSIIAKLILFRGDSVIWCQHMLTFALLYGKCSEIKETNSWVICCVFTEKISELNAVTTFFFFLTTWKHINESVHQTALSLLPYQKGNFKFREFLIVSISLWIASDGFCAEMAFFCVGEKSLGGMACITNNFLRKRRVCHCCFCCCFSLVLHNSEKQAYPLIIPLAPLTKLESAAWLRSIKPWLDLIPWGNFFAMGAL